MKTLKHFAPELYLFAAIGFYYISAAAVINWFAIGLWALLGLLVLSKSKVFGIVLGILLILINLYLVLALLSEFSEFDTFNADAAQLIGLGSLFLGLNLFFAGLLIYKNVKASITTVDR